MMDRSTKLIIAALIVLVIFTPLGLLAVGETFGEWGTEYFEEKLGYVPPGLEGLSSIWGAPMPDYGIPGLGDTTVGAAAGYIASAIIGSVVCVGAIYVLGKLVVKDSSN
jgi:cobalt/nickel transport protein